MTTPAAPTIPSPPAAREPRGYTPTYALATFGLLFAILTPTLAGLSIKMQNMMDGADPAVIATKLGYVTGLGAAFALVAQPLAGRLSDRTTSRFGMRRPWIVFGVVGAFLGYLVLGVTTTYWMLLVTWSAVQTFSNFAQATETATFADQVPPQRRGVVSGILGAVSPIAILAGSFVLTVLHTDFQRFVVPGGIGLVCGLLFAARLKDKILTEQPEPFGLRQFLGAFYFNPKTHQDFGWAWLTKALIMFGYATCGTYMTLFLRDKFGMTDTSQQSQWVLYTTLVAVVVMVITSMAGGRWSDRIGKRRPFIMVASIAMTMGILFTAASPIAGYHGGLAIILFGEVFIGVGGGLLFSVDLALCTEVLPDPENTAKDLGVLNFASTLPQMLAPTIAGIVFIPLGEAISPGFGFSLWFLTGAAVCLLAAPLVYKIKSVA